MSRQLWWCPPGRARRRGVGPWCAALPCPGHQATQEQATIARVLAARAGSDWWELPASVQAQWLTLARQALHDAGPGLGTPRR